MISVALRYKGYRARSSGEYVLAYSRHHHAAPTDIDRLQHRQQQLNLLRKVGRQSHLIIVPRNFHRRFLSEIPESTLYFSSSPVS